MKRTLLIVPIVAASVALATCGSSSSGAPLPAGIQQTVIPNGSLKLKALIARPQGTGRFPAVVLLHGCSGLWSKRDRTQPQGHIYRWLVTLQQRGFVAIAPDSFSARHVKQVCNTPPSKTGVSEVTDRARDAFAALEYLRSLSFVSQQRVAVLGWSNGGSTALASVGKNAPVNPPAAGGFRAAVAFYPGCGLRNAFRSYRPTVPTRVLSAQKDPLTATCRTRAKRAGKQFAFTVYKGARHSFDEVARTGADRKARSAADAAALGTLTQALAAQGGPSIFAPDSWINAPLPANAPLAPDQSPAAGLQSQIKQFGTWVNSTTWSAPLYIVGPDQPKVNIAVQTGHGYKPPQSDELAADFSGVPLPDNATPAGPPESFTGSFSDLELILYQPATDTAWELYHLKRSLTGQWSAMDGGRISHVSTSLGTYDPWPDGVPHGMTASGIPLLAGLQRLEELKRGQIDHVVSIAIPHAKKDAITPPAIRTDGNFTSPDAVAEGTLFRLPADLDIDSLKITPYAKIVARAIQSHGLVVVDRDCSPDMAKCPSVTFAAEDPRPQPDVSHANPYTAIFGGVPTEHLFDNFPWDQLQVLRQD
jgi:dienelactone hydrolase